MFPLGYDKPADDGSIMISPSGDRFTDGQLVDGAGGIVRSTLMPGGADGFWGSYIEFCDGRDVEMVILNDMEPAFDPAELSDAELRVLLETAELSVSWDCGFGFQLSTEDQRVALRIHPVDMETVPPPATFPDQAWEANAVIGKHLQVNNCDDVVEGWEPASEIVAVWPVTAGSLAFDIPTDSGCGIAGSVTATLDEFVVTTPTGDVELGNLSATNEAFGCFAG